MIRQKYPALILPDKKDTSSQVSHRSTKTTGPAIAQSSKGGSGTYAEKGGRASAVSRAIEAVTKISKPYETKTYWQRPSEILQVTQIKKSYNDVGKEILQMTQTKKSYV